MNGMGIFNLLAARFLMAFVLLAVVFFKRLRHIKRHTLVRGATMGALFFLMLSTELTGLKSTPSSTVSLLENTAIILVPMAEAVLRHKLPKAVTAVSALVAIGGVALLTGQSGGFTPGMVLAVMAAVLYAAAIITTDRFSHEDDPLTLGIVQVGTLGLLALYRGMGAALQPRRCHGPEVPQKSCRTGLVFFVGGQQHGGGVAVARLRGPGQFHGLVHLLGASLVAGRREHRANVAVEQFTVECRRLFVHPMGGAVAGTVRRGHRRDGKADAAAADGGQHPGQRIGREQEEHALRRLLHDLQQGVGGFLVHALHMVQQLLPMLLSQWTYLS